MHRQPAHRLLRAATALCLLVPLLAGCGGGGVGKGATVTVYVAPPLCESAQGALERSGARAGYVHVHATCLPRAEGARGVDLATVGADARRATEDTGAIAYLEGPNPTAARFSAPILESAKVPWLTARSGAAAMRRVLAAIRDSHSGDLRSSVRSSLGR